MTVQLGRGNFNDVSPPAPAGRVNVHFQLDDSIDPGLISAHVAASGTSGSTAVAVVVEIALTPGAPGNFTVAHGLPAAPAFVLIQMDSGGDIWFQAATRYDATNLYLTASDAGIVGKAQCWLLAATFELPYTSSIGNFSVAHGLGTTPVLVQIQKTAAGGVWLQTPAADATNVYLTGSDAGITGFIEVWKILPIPVSSNYVRVALAPGAPGNFTVAHGLGAVPFLAEIEMTSGGSIWFQSSRYDGTNLNLVASDAGITGYADVWAASPSSAVITIPVTAAQGGTGLTTLPAHAVLLGEGTSAVGSAAPGTSGYVLTSNGPSADPSFQAVTGGDATRVGVQNESYSYAADTGAANAYVVALTPTVSSYTAGFRCAVKAANTNTGTSTLNAGGGAVTIKKLNGTTNLVAGDIVAGQIFVVEYDGTNFQMISPVATASGGGDTTAKYLIGGADATLTNAIVWPGITTSPNVPPVSPGTLDDEFDSGSLSGSWTTLNSPATNVGNSILGMRAVAHSGTLFKAIYKACPATPWIAAAKMALTAGPSNFSATGLFIYDGTKIIQFGAAYNGGYVINIQRYTNPTTYSGTTALTMSGIAAFEWVYLAVKNDGTNLIYYVSADGAGTPGGTGNWIQVLSEVKTAFLASVADVGLCVDCETTSYDTLLHCDWFRRLL